MDFFKHTFEDGSYIRCYPCQSCNKLAIWEDSKGNFSTVHEIEVDALETICQSAISVDTFAMFEHYWRNERGWDEIYREVKQCQ